jgi:glycosyltransferase involved in cell wall biosynthesis
MRTSSWSHTSLVPFTERNDLIYKKKVSVIVYSLAYNHEPFIRDALEGFIAQQTTFDFVAVVHDDASTDKTAEIIREYEAKYPDRIRGIYQTENQNSKGTNKRKIVLDYAPDSKYVAFCECDDYWTDPLKLQKQYNFMEAHPDYVMNTHQTTMLNVDTKETTNYTRVISERDVSLEELCAGDFGTPHTSSFFMRREYFVYPEWFPLGVNGDIPTLLYCATKGKIYYMESVMSVYRRHSHGSWNARKDKNPSLLVKMHERYICVGELLDRDTGYVHSDTFYRWIIMHKYSLAVLQHKIRLIYYDAYKGSRCRYAWYHTFSLFANTFHISHLIPRHIKNYARKILTR